MDMDGILLIDKPKGWSSFDVIRKLRVTLAAQQATRNKQHAGNSKKRPPKMGHAGTLDPMATGLLIVLVGKATKKQDQFMKQDKRYEAEITLGATSTTDDAEGTITSSKQQAAGSKGEKEIEQPTLEKVQKVLEQFTGDIEQVPPQYSAVKVGGKRAYKTARSGGATELKARNVAIHSLELKEYAYPLLRVSCYVSSGTYIRSLARDIGEELDTGGYLSQLRRTKIGEYSVEDAAVADATKEQLLERLNSVD